LRERGLTIREIGTVLGVSPQRAQQLVRESQQAAQA
jgi:plasmid maintenance system antidote protein VapI